jgi:dihydropteroate synthase
VEADEELRRVIPALKAIRAAVSAPISIDSYKATVVRAALDAGANLINDQWGLMQEPSLAKLAVEYGVPIALMHNLPGGATGRQAELYPGGLMPGIIQRLRQGCDAALAAGVPWEQIIVDPGIGFAKGPEQNLEVVRRLNELAVIGRPILLGVSRKGFIGQALGGLPAHERLEGTAAAVAIGIAKGADMVRVHDVRAMVRVARMADALVR